MTVLILCCILLALVCTALGAYFVLLRRDIRRMAQTIRDASGEDTNAEVYTLTGDKALRQLAAEMNRMLGRHRQAGQRMRQADEAFKQSITGISHDLRTPLTSVTGYVQMLGSGNIPPEKQAEYLAIIEKRLGSLLVLLDELFAYTRLESERRHMEPEKLNTGSILMEQLAMYYQEFSARSAEPDIQIPPQPVLLTADKKCMERIFQNLIKNMLVHGAGAYRVSLEQRDGQVIIGFANNMEQEIQHPERLFERFYTGDTSRTQKTTGLGLAIVKQLAEAMGGVVSAIQRDGMLCIQLAFPQE